MASRLGFRQHIMLLVFMDLVLIFFAGFLSDSFIGQFLANPTGISLTAGAGLAAIFVTIFIGISAIGVTQGSNFAGIPGIMAGFLGKSAGNTAVIGVILAVVVDYVLIYNTITAGAAGTWDGYWLQITAMIIFLPLIIDALFASIDWARGVQT